MPSRQVAHNLAQLILAQEAQHRQPIVSLRDALLQLRLLDQPRLNALAMESPDLLRSSSSERVQRLLLTEDELHRALACVAGSAGIHIESNPGEALTVIRFRRDGDLAPCLRLPAKLRAPLVSRIKIMARLDIAERRRPQDGKIDFSEFGGKALELRVAIMPTQAGFSERTFGLVLAAGPTGSGKTTTLHAMLAEVNSAACTIWTAGGPDRDHPARPPGALHTAHQQSQRRRGAPAQGRGCGSLHRPPHPHQHPARGWLRSLWRQGRQGAAGRLRDPAEQPRHQAADPEPRSAIRDF